MIINARLGGNMEIRLYSEKDEVPLFDMLAEEGPEWECYHGEGMGAKYRRALENSITCVARDGNVLCGYLRCRKDDGFGVYVYDLLVRKACRGQGIGRKLMEFICASYPEEAVYVMSDVDEYYQKQGYRRVGSIFRVSFPE